MRGLSLYLDASVLIPLVLTEPRHPDVGAFLAAHSPPFIVPRLLVDLEAWYATTCRAPAVEEADVQVATAFVRRFELSLKLPDAIHHACANHLGLPVVTLDLRRYRAAESLGVAAMLPA